MAIAENLGKETWMGVLVAIFYPLLLPILAFGDSNKGGGEPAKPDEPIQPTPPTPPPAQ